MREPLPLATVVHTTAARTRLRIASRRGETGFFTRCAGQLAAAPGVATVEARALTGSLLVHHAEGAFDAVAEHAERAGLFIVAEIEPAAAPDAPPRLPPPPALAALAFGALGLFQLTEKRVLPPALTLFWYAATLAKEVGGNGGARPRDLARPRERPSTAREP